MVHLIRGQTSIFVVLELRLGQILRFAVLYYQPKASQHKMNYMFLPGCIHVHLKHKRLKFENRNMKLGLIIYNLGIAKTAYCRTMTLMLTYCN